MRYDKIVMYNYNGLGRQEIGLRQETMRLRNEMMKSGESIRFKLKPKTKGSDEEFHEEIGLDAI